MQMKATRNQHGMPDHFMNCCWYQSRFVKKANDSMKNATFACLPQTSEHHVCAYTYFEIYIYIYIDICMYMCVYIYIHIYIYIYI